jgi:hypothetical protein
MTTFAILLEERLFYGKNYEEPGAEMVTFITGQSLNCGTILVLCSHSLPPFSGILVKTKTTTFCLCFFLWINSCWQI